MIIKLLITGYILLIFSTPDFHELEGVWIDTDEADHKIVFTTNSCNIYYDNELVSQYSYTIVENNCQQYSAEGIDYLRLVDFEDNSVYCLEISNFENNSLSLMDIDQASVTLYNKQ